MACIAQSVFVTLEPIILASASPRRSELLASAGLVFEVVPSAVQETLREGESPQAAALRWAADKAETVGRRHPNEWVLAADTIVVLGEKILGKPQDGEQAARMLGLLSGCAHRVISGICLLHAERNFQRLEAVRTEVRFKELTGAEIAAYVQTGEPLDKAGAYGIQGMGAFMVESVCGSYTNVVGLPLCKTLSWLLELQVIAPRTSSSNCGV
ncbi:Maf family protein [Desulfoferrobacter suflitae]|uniref:Maf family protein n=1 Tax=Desulfoferrobacter suflitae TaxID=2865782 RepID=UPI00216456D9|nr:Maf family protein [Desulfoferrobacter suflitae]MCK8602265.1 Maf family protein [Desulfoferrobacter suflitae]